MPLNQIVALVVVACVLSACEDGEPKPTLAPTASALATSKSESEKAEPWKVAAKSTAEFVMPGKLETIKGTVDRAEGKLEIELADLTKTRGEIRMDMASLTTHTFGDKGKDETQTQHAKTWLEVSDGVEDAALRAKHRWAVFAVRSIERAEPVNIMKASGAERTATIKATGELLAHGHKSQHTLELIATFSFEGGRASKLVLKTRDPLQLDLEAHEIRPRDNIGKLVGWAGKTVLRDKVSERANISFALQLER
jgi:YceI-like domain